MSNLAYVSKVMEKVEATRLYKHMDVNDILEVLQSAYKELHSTETALVRVHSDIIRAIDEKSGSVFLVVLDLSSAFDTINHHSVSFLKSC